jgi:multiple sugar transport system ATP-binding protein
MSKVQLKDVKKAYSKNLNVVKGVNIEIEDGEFLVLVGPSGCGKSTILRMIAGLEEITEGQILIDEVVINDISPKDREIAMVFQNYALYPHMNVYNNLAFSLKMRKIKKEDIDKIVKQTAKMLDISEYLNRKPGQLSGGQKQRVALGRAVVRNPKVFLFDEPLSNLDAKLREKTRVQLLELHKKLGTTMIYVTHDQVEAMTMGDRICVLSDGEIMQIDSPLNLYNKPNNTFVASFIGSPTINLVRVIVQKEEFKICFGNYKMEVPKKVQKSIIDGEYKHIYLGIRPESIKINRKELDKNNFYGKVSVIEHMGNESFLYVCVEGIEEKIIIKVDSQEVNDIEINMEYCFEIDIDRIHYFDCDNGKNIEIR